MTTSFDLELAPSNKLYGEMGMTYATFASDVGIGPGLFHQIDTVNVISDEGIGNGLPYHLIEVTSTQRKYTQDCGCMQLIIYND